MEKKNAVKTKNVDKTSSVDKLKDINRICKEASNKETHFGDPNYRMLADGYFVSNDTHKTMKNNNDFICGGTGRSKTTSYVEPLIEQMCGSMIISDTKNTLYYKHADKLRAAGYRVLRLDMITGEDSCTYNPLEYVRYDEENDSFNERDIVALTNMLCNSSCDKDMFWIESAQMMLSSIISYVLEATPFKEHHMGSVAKLFNLSVSKAKLDRLMSELEAENPDSFAVSRYKRFCSVTQAEKTYACILMFAANAINNFDCKETKKVFEAKNDIDFRDIGREKTALFINMSDSERSMDKILCLLYRDLLGKLMRYADSLPEKRLPVPVRFIMDDFASGSVIQDFSKIISVIRSREISVSIIVQTVSQLDELYSHEEAKTIIANCDHFLFLGGNDNETADFISKKMNVPVHKIMGMPIDTAYLFEAGNPKCGMRVKKYYPDYIKNAFEKDEI